MSRPYRFAVIGTGFFAQNHLHAWAEIPDVELVAVCDTDPERLAAAARDFVAAAFRPVPARVVAPFFAAPLPAGAAALRRPVAAAGRVPTALR
ncbi:MAG: Gfo/Idh/MocA family oxidoreductase, partial [Actinomycetota bacterium]